MFEIIFVIYLVSSTGFLKLIYLNKFVENLKNAALLLDQPKIISDTKYFYHVPFIYSLIIGASSTLYGELLIHNFSPSLSVSIKCLIAIYWCGNIVYTEFILVWLCRKHFSLYRNARICSWIQPVLSKECKVSCSRKKKLGPDWVWIHVASSP